MHQNSKCTIVFFYFGGILASKRGSSVQNDQRNLKAFGERVKELRSKKNLTIYDVTGSDMPIKSRQHWGRIERGEKNINLTTIYKVAATLEISPDKLFI